MNDEVVINGIRMQVPDNMPGLVVSVPLKKLSPFIRELAKTWQSIDGDFIQNGQVQIDGRFREHPENADAIYDSELNRVDAHTRLGLGVS